MTTTPHQPQRLTRRGTSWLIAFYAILFVGGIGVAGSVEADRLPLSVGLIYGIGVSLIVGGLAEIGRRL